MLVTFSEDTTEAAAEAMEEFLQRPSGGNSGGGHSAFKPITAMLRGRRKAKKKKGSKVSTTDDTMSTESPLVIAKSQRGDEESGESSPSSPLREGTNSSRKTSSGGGASGMLRRAKGSLLNHLRSHDHAEESSEVNGERSDDQIVNESGDIVCEMTEDKSRKKKKILGSLNKEPNVQPRLQISSPLTRDWSGSELRNEELQGLIKPHPQAWTKMGYLWLRMHTAENRYEWTHIVSIISLIPIIRFWHLEWE